jgi:hypothetical protein
LRLYLSKYSQRCAKASSTIQAQNKCLTLKDLENSWDKDIFTLIISLKENKYTLAFEKKLEGAHKLY